MATAGSDRTALPRIDDPARGYDLSAMDLRALSRVWSLPGATGGVTWRAQDLPAILRHQLDAPLEDLEVGNEDAPTAAATPSAAGGAGSEPATFGELLLHPRPPQELLELVKEWAKAAKSPPDGDGREFVVPPEVATVLYFAAIAAALARLGTRITSLDDTAVAKGVKWALDQPWVEERLGGVLRDGLAGVTSNEG